MQNLNDLCYFAKVVDAGGFAAAGRLLGIPKSRLSRRLAELETRLAVFDYQAGRSGVHARAFLGDWKGHLVVDDYAGYKALFAMGIREVGCMLARAGGAASTTTGTFRLRIAWRNTASATSCSGKFSLRANRRVG